MTEKHVKYESVEIQGMDFYRADERKEKEKGGE